MEEALMEKAVEYLKRGDELKMSNRFQRAFEMYLNAMLAVGALLVYSETGMLLGDSSLMRILKDRFPDVFKIIDPYVSALPGYVELGIMRRDLLRLMAKVGMMNLPSSEELG